MKISYFVGVGESFKPPVRGQAPSNFLPDKHRIEWRRHTDGSWLETIHPIWSQNCEYRLLEKPVRVVRYHGVLSTGTVTGEYVNTTAVEGCPFMLEVISEDGKVVDAKLIRKGEK